MVQGSSELVGGLLGVFCVCRVAVAVGVAVFVSCSAAAVFEVPDVRDLFC